MIITLASSWMGRVWVLIMQSFPKTELVLSTITDRNGFFKLKREKGVISHLKVRTPKKDTIITTFDIVADGESWEDGTEDYSSILTSDTTRIVIK